MDDTRLQPNRDPEQTDAFVNEALRLENCALDAEIYAEDRRGELCVALGQYREARAEARRARARAERFLFLSAIGETFGAEVAAIVDAHAARV